MKIIISPAKKMNIDTEFGIRDLPCFLDKTEFLIDVGGSKESVESKVIKYGGKVKIELDEDKAFKLTPDMDTYPISIRGEKWSEL